MRYVVLTLATVAIVVLTSSSANAGHGYGRQSGYVGYQGYSQYSAGHQYQSNRYAPSYGHSSSRAYIGMTYGESVHRIMAKHSRYRYQTHPRSMYNEPPRYGHGYSRW